MVCYCLFWRSDTPHCFRYVVRLRCYVTTFAFCCSSVVITICCLLLLLLRCCLFTRWCHLFGDTCYSVVTILYTLVCSLFVIRKLLVLGKNLRLLKLLFNDVTGNLEHCCSIVANYYGYYMARLTTVVIITTVVTFDRWYRYCDCCCWFPLVTPICYYHLLPIPFWLLLFVDDVLPMRVLHATSYDVVLDDPWSLHCWHCDYRCCC